MTNGGLPNSEKSMIFSASILTLLLVVGLWFFLKHERHDVEQSKLLFAHFNHNIESISEIIMTEFRVGDAGSRIHLDQAEVDEIKEFLKTLRPRLDNDSFEKVTTSNFCGAMSFISQSPSLGQIQFEFYANSRSSPDNIKRMQEFNGSFVIRNNNYAIVLAR